MRKIIEVLRLITKATAAIADRPCDRHLTDDGRRDLRRAREAGVTWPLPQRPDEPELESRLFPPAAPSTIRLRTRLAGCIANCGARASPSTSCGRNTRPGTRTATATAASATISGNGSAPAVGEHAPDAHPGREAVPSTTPARRCRSSIGATGEIRQAPSSSPCSAPPTTPMPRRPGRSTAGLDRLPRPYLRVSRRCSRDPGARQPEVAASSHACLLRSRNQPDLPRSGPALRRRRAADPTAPPEGQGQGRGWRAASSRLGPGAAAPPSLLQPRANCNQRHRRALLRP